MHHVCYQYKLREGVRAHIIESEPEIARLVILSSHEIIYISSASPMDAATINLLPQRCDGCKNASINPKRDANYADKHVYPRRHTANWRGIVIIPPR